MLQQTSIIVLQPLVRFALRHDELPWFRVWFTVATVIASIVFNLGIFFLLVLGHMGLDTIKYRTLHRLTWKWTVIETIRESMVDVFFIVFGLFLALAFHHAFAIGGFGKLAATEVLFLEAILRIGPRLKIAEHILEIVTYWRHHFALRVPPGMPLTRGEQWVCGMIALTTLAIILLPMATELTWSTALATMQHEIVPRLELGITKTLEELH